MNTHNYGQLIDVKKDLSVIEPHTIHFISFFEQVYSKQLKKNLGSTKNQYYYKLTIFFKVHSIILINSKLIYFKRKKLLCILFLTHFCQD